jgi:quaternary ammonium compound-resistance protein SugE
LNWIILIVAGLLEIGWAIGLKYTEGFTRPWPTVVTIAAMIASMGLLGIAVRTLPIGTAYAVWTGIGTLGTVTAGIFLLGESTSIPRLICVLLIVIGILGLKLTASHS